MAHLQLDAARIASARDSARRIAQQVWQEMQPFTTTTVERASLRLMGMDGIDENQVPLPNRVVEHLQTQGLLPLGAATVVAAAMAEQGWTAQQVAQAVAAGRLTLGAPRDMAAAQRSAREQAHVACQRIQRQREHRAAKVAAVGEARTPWLYLIVATGNIFEDIVQARAAAEQGADIIAVIRSTGQSLLDYVPYGATTEGFGGTYATQENFRLMRAALDEVGDKVGATSA
jgi:beta-lysine 5,6-aminomutase alpha subunit